MKLPSKTVMYTIVPLVSVISIEKEKKRNPARITEGKWSTCNLFSK